MNRKKAIFTAIALLFLSVLSKAQSESYSLKHFVPMDDSMKQMIAFYSVDTLLVISPDGFTLNKEEKESIEQFAFWKKAPVHLYKSVSDLLPRDSVYNRQYVGPLSQYPSQMLPDLPVEVMSYGFVFNGQHFTNPDDFFYWMHPEGKMIFTNGNSLQAGMPYAAFLSGGAYSFYIFSGNTMVYSGMIDKEEESVNSMDALRQSYFCSRLHSRFFNIYIACDLNHQTDTTLGQELDQFVEQLCVNLSVEPSFIHPVTCYFYNDHVELQHFIAAPLWQTVYGKSMGNINHISGSDLQILKHEVGHSVINATLGLNPMPFFAEGLRQYTDYAFNNDAYMNDLQITKDNIHLLTEELLFDNGLLFFRSMDHYSISGIFNCFLVNFFGPDAYKDAYTKKTFDKLLYSSGYTPEMLIGIFKRDYCSKADNHQTSLQHQNISSLKE